MDDIIADCERIRCDIQNLNDTSYGPLDNKYSQKSTKLPFVLLLGKYTIVIHILILFIFLKIFFDIILFCHGLPWLTTNVIQ